MGDILNAAQVAVLQWINDGCPGGVFEGDSHKLSAAALRTRGLVRTSGRGASWHAEITDRGRAYLADPPPNKRGRRLVPRVGARNKQGDKHDSPPGSHPPAAPPSAQVPLLPTPAPPSSRTIRVPNDLRGAHPFVTATRDAATGLRGADDGRITIGPRPGVVHTVVTREHLRRGLLVVQAILTEASERGWTVQTLNESYGARPGVAIVIRGHEYPIELHERTETVPFTQEEIQSWRQEWSWRDRTERMPPAQLKRKRATGKLRLELPNGFRGGRCKWTEGPRATLEDKLASVFETLEARADEDDASAIEAARRAEEFRREQEAREANARRARIEQARAERLLGEAEAWQRSTEVRAYLAALRDRLPSLSEDERDRIAAWYEWAKGWADRNDPVLHTSLIAGVDDERDQLHHPRRF